MGASSGQFCSGPEFLAAVTRYFSLVGQGLFTRADLYTPTFDVITCGQKVSLETPGVGQSNCVHIMLQVSVEASGRLQFLLGAITAGLQSYQMACGAAFVLIQQQLSQVLKLKPFVSN